MHTAFRPAFLALSLLALSTLSGCGVNTTLTGPAATSIQTRVGGTLHGGQQPIAFATIQLWSAGTNGYGSQGQLFATTQTADDGAGSFGFLKQPNTDTPYPSASNTWACPASSDPYMYLVARGGNTQGSHLSSAQNSAVGFLLAIGRCSTISQSSFYFLNEVTTAGSLAALTQFFSPVTETVGAPASTLAQQGLANAFALVPTLVDTAAGVPQTIKRAYVYSLVDAAKLNTLGDVTASCINSALPSSPTCTILFANAAPPSPLITSQPASTFPAATDTLQALWYMFANPADGSTTRRANLYGLVPPNPPFQPALTSQPTDWTVTVTAVATTPNGKPVFDTPTQTVVAPTGDIDFTTNNSRYSGVVEFTPSGDGEFISEGPFEATSVAWDKRANLWISQQSPDPYDNSYLHDYIFTAGQLYVVSGEWYTSQPEYVVVPLPNGDVSWASRTGSLHTISSALIDASQQYGQQGYDTHTSTLRATLPGQIKALIADASGNLWMACADGNLYELIATSSTPVVAASIGTDFIDNISALAIDSSGAVLLPTHPTTGIPQVLRVSGSPTAGYTTTTLPGTASALAIAVDGAGNIWQASSATETLNGVVSGFITAMTSSGTPLLGAAGIARPATSTATSSTLVQNVPVLGPSAGMAIDLAGDIWVSNTGTNLFNTADGPQYSVTELVGAAVPVTPPSVGLFNSTLAQKP